MLRTLSLCLALFVPVLALAQDAGLTLPAGHHAAHLRDDRSRVVDCSAHGAWIPPASWATTEVAMHDVVASAPEGDAWLVRSGRVRITSDETFRSATLALVTRVLGVAPTLGEVVAQPHDRWRVDRSLDGTVTSRGHVLRVRATSAGSRHLWVSLAADASHDAALEAARTSWLPLVDHACVCGNDCDRAPATR